MKSFFFLGNYLNQLQTYENCQNMWNRNFQNECSECPKKKKILKHFQTCWKWADMKEVMCLENIVGRQCATFKGGGLSLYRIFLLAVTNHLEISLQVGKWKTISPPELMTLVAFLGAHKMEHICAHWFKCVFLFFFLAHFFSGGKIPQNIWALFFCISA